MPVSPSIRVREADPPRLAATSSWTWSSWAALPIIGEAVLAAAAAPARPPARVPGRFGRDEAERLLEGGPPPRHAERGGASEQLVELVQVDLGPIGVEAVGTGLGHHDGLVLARPRLQSVAQHGHVRLERRRDVTREALTPQQVGH